MKWRILTENIMSDENLYKANNSITHCVSGFNYPGYQIICTHNKQTGNYILSFDVTYHAVQIISTALEIIVQVELHCIEMAV
jgi:hypothetical protein